MDIPSDIPRTHSQRASKKLSEMDISKQLAYYGRGGAEECEAAANHTTNQDEKGTVHWFRPQQVPPHSCWCVVSP